VLLKLVIDVVLQILGTENAEFGLFFLMPISLVISLVMNCSYYASYVQMFGSPEQPEPGNGLPG
jgi:hypothetical protein